MKRAAVAPYSKSFTVIIFNPLSTHLNAQNRSLLWYITPKFIPPVLRAAPQRKAAWRPHFQEHFIHYFFFHFYRRYRRITWAKPLRKAPHVQGWGYNSDAADSRTIALVQGSLQLLTRPPPARSRRHTKDDLSCSPWCVRCVRMFMIDGRKSNVQDIL